jgi:hypothetical protein
MTDLPPEYFADAHKMDDAARAWFKAHPFAEPRFRIREFENDMKRRAGRPLHENVAVAAPLDESVIAQVAANEDGKALLRAMDAATGGRGTYMQAKALIELAMEAQIARGQHQMTVGHWVCPCCARPADGITMTDGSGPPPPGTIGMCFYCGATMRVNATVTGLESMSMDEVAALPAPMRKMLHDLRNMVQARMAQEAKRS